MDTVEVWQLHERLLGFIRKRLPAEADAEDVLQEVFERVHAKLGSLRDEQSLRPWVYAIARRAIADSFRRRARSPIEPAVSASAIEIAPDNAGADDEATAEQELARCLRPLLAGLPDEYREALELTELGDLTQSAAARQAGVSHSGMKSRVQRGRAMLRERLLSCCRVELDRAGHVVGADVPDEPCCDGTTPQATAPYAGCNQAPNSVPATSAEPANGISLSEGTRPPHDDAGALSESVPRATASGT